jgi:hypothetical protein
MMTLAGRLFSPILVASTLAAGQGAPMAGFVRVEPIHAIADGLDAWPLIVNPKSDAERRINNTLDSYNAQTRQILRKCDEDASRNAGDAEAPGESASDKNWDRAIRVTMAGPRYLSLRASGSIFCGGMHPDRYDAALIFDLDTGELLDGSTIVAKDSQIKVALASSIPRYPQSDKFLLSSPALDRITIARANEDCKRTLKDVEDGQGSSPILYSVWPEAEKNMVVVMPVSLGYLDYLTCAEEVEISPDQARKLGFAGRFLASIAEAHRNWHRR